MLHAKNIPKRFWAEAMRTVALVINKLPQQRLGFVSPFEKLWDMKPTVSYFRVFGCVCYVFVPDHLRSKFDKKVVRCIFVGYDNQRKGWKCCDPITGRCYIS
ncbi:hypothetical protein Pint_11086 [Pistacia integerrima]|uniref:Uncharacterized protein n=2 Tax=Pistacia TaxID=55512 RepID=A0ACC1A9J6_9ROSI|nr:hypothetical protein Pint_11086 [Pistacia integerrima]KAJ0082920.1 hypothetical protein Patl1_11226 [Pistacia atlantica]